MTRFPAFIFTLTATALLAGACSQEQSALHRAPGTYKETTSSTDAQGTTTRRTTSTEVKVDDEGRKSAVVETKTTRDPKGLFNKRTVSETRRVMEEE